MRTLWGLGALLGIGLFPGSAQALPCPPLPPGIVRALESGTPVPPPTGLAEIRGGILPHHDLAGPMIQAFYATLQRQGPAPRRIVLLTPDHYRAGRTALSFCGASWETPLGPVPGDAAGVAALTSALGPRRDDRLFLREHGVTVHLPLLARFFPGVPVLPVAVRNSASDLELLVLRKVLASLLRSGGLVLLSMDLSHGKTAADALREDARTIPALLRQDKKALSELDLDCPRGSALLGALLKELGASRGVLLDHATSSTFDGRPEAPGTSYATLLFGR